MIELVDWTTFEPLDPGTPGWYTLAARVSGETSRPAAVFVAAESNPSNGRCLVLLAADFPEVGPAVVTPFSLEIRLTIEGIHTYVLAGANVVKEIEVLSPG